MIKNFNEQEKVEIKKLFEDILWFDGVEHSYGDNKRKIIVNIDLVNKILNGKIEIKNISENDYEDLIFALTSTQKFLYCVANEEDSTTKKFLEALENDRKS